MFSPDLFDSTPAGEEMTPDEIAALLHRLGYSRQSCRELEAADAAANEAMQEMTAEEEAYYRNLEPSF